MMNYIISDYFPTLSLVQPQGLQFQNFPGWIVLIFCTHIYVPHRINCNNLGNLKRHQSNKIIYHTFVQHFTNYLILFYIAYDHVCICRYFNDAYSEAKT